MPRMLPVLLGGDANVYGMARSFYECYGVRSLAVCRRALPALAHSRLVRVAVQDPAFGQDHVFTATLLGLAAQYPGVPKILISCADDYTALLARHADALRGRTALPARRPRRCIWPISGSLLRPAAPQGCAHRRP